jgi:hypothetical protein
MPVDTRAAQRLLDEVLRHAATRVDVHNDALETPLHVAAQVSVTCDVFALWRRRDPYRSAAGRSWCTGCSRTARTSTPRAMVRAACV